MIVQFTPTHGDVVRTSRAQRKCWQPSHPRWPGRVDGWPPPPARKSVYLVTCNGYEVKEISVQNRDSKHSVTFFSYVINMKKHRFNIYILYKITQETLYLQPTITCLSFPQYLPQFTICALYSYIHRFRIPVRVGRTI